MPASQSALELEYDTVLRTGQLKEAFIRLRRQLEQAIAERDAAVAELTRLRSQPARRQESTRPVLTPMRPDPPEPVREPPPVEEPANKDLDDVALRFSLLELD